ncbi:isocitrate lyase/phosphoenolpyruvate mutase family protein [Plantactinospora sp. KBS50]|uniref:isocitrate lyase/PEP mutase family protein n=1 Tax=Plantactinospora sp. KBS50 TaxID=2024580 RepID=UPI000BAAA21B|nr:isocitrate lyase/phosphoenolpyruvate mutase family protein [Plantactinospora sp. KBS50]ASW55618.1 2-methylisocitrate lyase [Plantactinospora sp. KBS50]
MSIDRADQSDRADRFARLHQQGSFVIPNPWDAGTARLLTGLGFAALATTSGGLAFGAARADGANLVGRDETLANVAAIVAATSLPVSADLENGFGPEPSDVAETIRRAAAAGAVGGSVEDATGMPDAPILPLGEAVRRVRAAVLAAAELPFPFLVTARADNFFHGRADLPDTIRRLRAYQDAGAHVLYAPALPGPQVVAQVCAAVDRPVNVLAGSSSAVTVERLAAAGARRISLGSALARTALSATLAAAREVADRGTFGFAERTLSYPEINDMMDRTGAKP